LQGHEVRGPLPPLLRTYRCVAELGMSPAEVDDTPALTIDWLLAIHDVHERVRAEAEEKAARA
jgi:hypothetical protein